MTDVYRWLTELEEIQLPRWAIFFTVVWALSGIINDLIWIEGKVL